MELNYSKVLETLSKIGHTATMSESANQASAVIQTTGNITDVQM